MNKKKVKIAIVCTGIPNFHSEGAAKEPLILSNHLKKRGIKHKIFAIETDSKVFSSNLKIKDSISALRKKNIEVIKKDDYSLIYKIFKILFNRKSLYFYGTDNSFKELEKKILSYSPDLIFPFFNSAISFTSPIKSIPQYLYAGIPPHSIEEVRIKNFFSEFYLLDIFKIIKSLMYIFLVKKVYGEMFRNKRMIIVSSPDSTPFYMKFSKKVFPYNNFTKNYGVKFNKYKKNNKDFILVGNVKATFTREGLYNFSNVLVNYLSNMRKKIKFNIRIIGHFKPTKKISKNLNFPWITFTGWVKNLSKEYKNALAILVPTTVLCGTRIRIINAMQAGVPVIAYRNNVKFNKEFINKKNIYIADNHKQFVRWMKFFLNQNNYSKISKSTLDAKKTVNKFYDPNKICAQIIDRVLKDFKKN